MSKSTKTRRTPPWRKKWYRADEWILVDVERDEDFTQHLSLLLPPRDSENLCRAKVECSNDERLEVMSLAELFNSVEAAERDAQWQKTQRRHAEEALAAILSQLNESDVSMMLSAIDPAQASAYAVLKPRLMELEAERLKGANDDS